MTPDEMWAQHEQDVAHFSQLANDALQLAIAEKAERESVILAQEAIKAKLAELAEKHELVERLIAQMQTALSEFGKEVAQIKAEYAERRELLERVTSDSTERASQREWG